MKSNITMNFCVASLMDLSSYVKNNLKCFKFYKISEFLLKSLPLQGSA